MKNLKNKKNINKNKYSNLHKEKAKQWGFSEVPHEWDNIVNEINRKNNLKINSNSNKMEVYILDIDPVIATMLLSRNIQTQRKCSKANVKHLINEMKNKHWIDGVSHLLVNDEKNVCDGQHRLIAIKDSKTTQKMTMTIGVPKKAFQKLDQGKKRSGADIFQPFDIKRKNENICRVIEGMNQAKNDKTNSNITYEIYNRCWRSKGRIITEIVNFYNNINNLPFPTKEKREFKSKTFLGALAEYLDNDFLKGKNFINQILTQDSSINNFLIGMRNNYIVLSPTDVQMSKVSAYRVYCQQHFLDNFPKKNYKVDHKGLRTCKNKSWDNPQLFK